MSSVSALEQLLKNRDYQSALPLSQALLRAQPRNPSINAMHGHVLLNLARYEEARVILEQTAILQARIPSVWLDLANVYIALKNWKRAREALTGFQRLVPKLSAAAVFAAAEINLGMGNLKLAETEFRQAAQMHPAWLDRRFRLGSQAFDYGDFARAEWHYSACAALRPTWIEAWLNFATSLLRQHRPDDAVAVIAQARKAIPNEVRLLERHAQLLGQCHLRYEEQLQVSRDWVAVSPQSILAYQSLVAACLGLGLNSEALRHLDTITHLDPTRLSSRWLKLHVPDHLYFASDADMAAFLQRWRAAIAEFETVDFSQDPWKSQCQELLARPPGFRLIYVRDSVLEDQRRYARIISRMMDNIVPVPALKPYQSKERRRIGVISAHLSIHSVSRVWKNLLLALDPEVIELRLYHLSRLEDEFTAEFRRVAASFENGPYTIMQWSEVLAAAKLDVLIFLDLGGDAIAQALATRRFAPIQCTTWAQPASSGQHQVDYFLSSELAEPENAETHYSEQLVRLPGMACAYRFDPPQRAAEAGAAQPSGLFINRAERTGYFCAQNGLKLLPEYDRLFAQVLQALPESVLGMSPGFNENTMQGLRARMAPVFQASAVVMDERVQLFPLVPYDDYLALLKHVDVMLDTWHFSGGLTSLDALSMEIPIVTLPGKFMRGRQTYAMLKLLELTELIAQDKEDYVRIAVELGRNRDWREEIKQRIRERKHRLYETEKTVQALQKFLLSAPVRTTSPSEVDSYLGK